MVRSQDFQIFRICGLLLAKMCLRADVDIEGPDQPAHSHSLIKAFTVH